MRESLAAKLVLVLAGLCCVAALVLVQVRFEARKLQARLDQAERYTLSNKIENRRFQIELATLTDYAVLHASALDEHGMVYPDAGSGTMIALPRAQTVAVVEDAR